ncbi:MAG: hypothetical protein WA191_06675 [Telluria sp.]
MNTKNCLLRHVAPFRSAIWRPAFALALVAEVFSAAFGYRDASAQSVERPATRYEYDAVGNLTLVADPRGNAVTQEYDNLNRLKREILPAPNAKAERPTIGFSYDGLNQITKITDPRNLATSYSVDGLGNQYGLSSPDTGGTTRTFDAVGNLKTSKDARGFLTTYEYDELSRLKTIRYAAVVSDNYLGR